MCLGTYDMKQISMRISLTAAVALLTASFSGLVSSHSDSADGIDLKAKCAEEALWSDLMPAYAPVLPPAAPNVALDVWAVMVNDIGCAQAERVVQSPCIECSSESGRENNLEFGGAAEPSNGAAPYKDLWARLRAGFAMPRLNSRHVARYETRYFQSPAHLQRVLERSRPYLYFIVGELEKRGMP